MANAGLDWAVSVVFKARSVAVLCGIRE